MGGGRIPDARARSAGRCPETGRRPTWVVGRRQRRPAAARLAAGEAALPAGAADAAAAFPRQALHAASLGFAHPRSGAEMRFEAPPPADFTDLLERLRKDGATGAFNNSQTPVY